MIAEIATNVATMLPAVVDDAGSFWNFTWTVPSALQDVTQKIAFFLGVIWLIYIISQFVMPSKRGGGKGLKAGSIIMVLVAIVILCDLSLIPTIINWIGKVAWDAAKMFGFR